MRQQLRLVGLLSAVLICVGADAFACGDKFLVGGRGTRYQRPRNARAASVLMYSNPASGLPDAFGKLPVESTLKRQGHRLTVAESLDQLAALLTGGRYDVILAASGVAAAIEDLLKGKADAPVVVAFCIKGQPTGELCTVKAPPKERTLLEAIDKAVEQHDRNTRAATSRG